MSNDLWDQCYDNRVSPNDFSRMFCRICRNPECGRSGVNKSKWVERMSTQVARLLEDPQFTDSKDPRFQHIREKDFKDMFMEALRLEVATRRGDWETPSTQEVLLAAQQMLLGNHANQVVEPETTEPEPEPVEPEPETPLPEVLWESRVKGTEGGYYKVVLEKVGASDPVWYCSCPAFKYRKDPRILCKHIISQQALYEARVAQPPAVKPPPPKPQPAQRNPQVVGPEKTNFRPPMMNIPVPVEGLMVDGSPPPKPQPPKAAADPWTPKPRETIIAVGAKVTMGSTKK